MFFTTAPETFMVGRVGLSGGGREEIIVGTSCHVVEAKFLHRAMWCTDFGICGFPISWSYHTHFKLQVQN
uniref:Uncharacterized protein n=1 Tax=Rhizophora mucronata TaxID=61149 RepID=A0A2P2NGD2_RHIMU